MTLSKKFGKEENIVLSHIKGKTEITSQFKEKNLKISNHAILSPFSNSYIFDSIELGISQDSKTDQKFKKTEYSEHQNFKGKIEPPTNFFEKPEKKEKWKIKVNLKNTSRSYFSYCQVEIYKGKSNELIQELRETSRYLKIGPEGVNTELKFKFKLDGWRMNDNQFFEFSDEKFDENENLKIEQKFRYNFNVSDRRRGRHQLGYFFSLRNDFGPFVFNFKGYFDFLRRFLEIWKIIRISRRNLESRAITDVSRCSDGIWAVTLQRDP